MKKASLFLLSVTLLALLAGCQSVQRAEQVFSRSATETPSPIPPTPTDLPAPTFTVTPYPTRTPLPGDPLKAAVETYFNALAAQDAAAAANVYSSYSLMVHKVTRDEAAAALQARFAAGERWSGLAVIENRPLDAVTTLVHVTYQVESKDAKTGAAASLKKDEWWPLRDENGQWTYNLDNLIDFRTLETPEQTTAGLTVKPRQITRYSDHMTLTLLVQNQTNDSIVLGQQNEDLATFHFGDQDVLADKTQLIFERLHSYPDTTLVLQGLYEKYPDGVTIRQWKNLQVAPWYVFDFNQ
jgi:VCBS repeat-containing protein